MNYFWWLGMASFMLAGALLHDVPFLRFVLAMILISLGTILGFMSKG